MDRLPQVTITHGSSERAPGEGGSSARGSSAQAASAQRAVRADRRPRWTRVGPKHIARHAGYRLEVFLKPELRGADGPAFDDAWGWRFTVMELDGTEVLRGLGESREEAMRSAVRKAGEALPADPFGRGAAFAS